MLYITVYTFAIDKNENVRINTCIGLAPTARVRERHSIADYDYGGKECVCSPLTTSAVGGWGVRFWPIRPVGGGGGGGGGGGNPRGDAHGDEENA